MTNSKRFSPVPLHKGFGYIAEAKLLSAPSAEKKVEPELKAEKNEFSSVKSERSTRLTALTLTQKSNFQDRSLTIPEPPQSYAQMKASLFVKEEKVAVEPQVEEFSLNMGMEVGRLRALAAWLLDSLLAASIVVFSAGLIYAIGPTKPILKASEFIAANLTAFSEEKVVLVTWLVELGVVSAFLIFVFQLVNYLICGSSWGRSAMGIYISAVKFKPLAYLTACLVDVVSLGGLLSLPFILITPGRLPLFPFIKLSSNK